jgi:hypothetical protein
MTLSHFQIPSFPRRRESSEKINLGEADKNNTLSRYAGLIQPTGFPPARE